MKEEIRKNYSRLFLPTIRALQLFELHIIVLLQLGPLQGSSFNRDFNILQIGSLTTETKLPVSVAFLLLNLQFSIKLYNSLLLYTF